MAGRLEGKVALVTGGSRGIGRAICQRFAREGAALVVNYTSSREKADGLVTEVIQSGGRAVALQADVSSKAAITSLVQAAQKQIGPIDILINNAGILKSGSVLKLNE